MSLRKITIQIYSDLHLELTKAMPKIKPLSPYLFLAGDISKLSSPTFKEFMNYCNTNWEKTFYIMGNHDYWDTTSNMQDIKRNIINLLQEDKLTKIKLIDNNIVELNDDLCVFGSTFWTKSPFETSKVGKMYINDYNMMRIIKADTNKTSEITPQDINSLNFTDECAIISLLNSQDASLINKKIIMMTHFPPQRKGTSHPKFDNETHLVKNYFTHPDDTIKKLGDISNIACWISGHTHYSYDFVSPEGIRLISNQFGYLQEVMKGETKFNQDGLFDIYY